MPLLQLNLSLGPKKAGTKGGQGKREHQTLWAQVSQALNPLKWFAGDSHTNTGE